MNKVYFEKLRPRNVDQLALTDDVSSTLKGIFSAKAQNVPHLILAGPPGTGKTSTARILADHLLGSRNEINYLELNASKDRGVDTIRQDIYEFVRTRAFLPKDCPFRVVFLDQACELTATAQNALRNLLETYSSNSRFIFSCNQVQKIISPLKSRALLINFETIPVEKQVEALCLIARNRGIDVKEKEARIAALSGRGDMRKTCINLLGGTPKTEKSLMEVFHETSLEDLPSRLFDLKNSIGAEYATIIQQAIDQVLTSRINVDKKLVLATTVAKAQQGIAMGASTYNQMVPVILGLKKQRVW